MKKFKIAVSKGQKKYTLVLKAEHESEAKQRVHKEWYSILSLQEIWDEQQIWHAYSFVWKKDNEVKTGKVMWDELFKVYIKLRKDLWYEISEIYSADIQKPSQEEINKQLRNLEQEYQIYLETLDKAQKKEKKVTTEKTTTKVDKTQETNID